MRTSSQTPSAVLDQPIAKGHALRIRDIVLSTSEMMMIEVHLCALKESVTMEGETPDDARLNLVNTLEGYVFCSLQYN